MSVAADWDVFNGDADGICGLVQLRLAEPRQSHLVTGIKRDIQLLQRVDAKAGDRVTVLDISLDKNRDHLQRILQTGAEVFYVDHHYAGEIPASACLQSMINEAPDVCTSLLVNQYLRGAFTHWAVVGTFGDNLKKTAHTLAKGLQLKARQLDQLENLGIFINYNGYGSDLDELHYHPKQLFQLLLPYKNPLDFIEDGREHYQKLEAGYRSDLLAAESAERLITNESIALYVLPNQAWARRVSGVFSNQLANQSPDRAHAVLTTKSTGNYIVSVRAPLNNKQGAATLCRQFASGGGREAAAGINDLPTDKLQEFIDRFADTYRKL